MKKRPMPNAEHIRWTFYIGISKEGDPMLSTISYNPDWVSEASGVAFVAEYEAAFSGVGKPHKCKAK